jgi:hypothetical protein
MATGEIERGLEWLKLIPGAEAFASQVKAIKAAYWTLHSVANRLREARQDLREDSARVEEIDLLKRQVANLQAELQTQVGNLERARSEKFATARALDDEMTAVARLEAKVRHVEANPLVVPGAGREVFSKFPQPVSTLPAEWLRIAKAVGYSDMQEVTAANIADQVEHVVKAGNSLRDELKGKNSTVTRLAESVAETEEIAREREHLYEWFRKLEELLTGAEPAKGALVDPEKLVGQVGDALRNRLANMDAAQRQSKAFEEEKARLIGFAGRMAGMLGMPDRDAVATDAVERRMAEVLSHVSGRAFALAIPPFGPSISVLGQIVDERRRQVAKGWTPEHDDRHSRGELLVFAIGILLPDHMAEAFVMEMVRGWKCETWVIAHVNKVRQKYLSGDSIPVDAWNRRLTIAAALLVAEAERRERCWNRRPTFGKEVRAADADTVAAAGLNSRCSILRGAVCVDGVTFEVPTPGTHGANDCVRFWCPEWADNPGLVRRSVDLRTVADLSEYFEFAPDVWAKQIENRKFVVAGRASAGRILHRVDGKAATNDGLDVPAFIVRFNDDEGHTRMALFTAPELFRGNLG